MNEAEAPALIQLNAEECERRLAEEFASARTSFPIRTAVGEALMLAEMATQRIAIDRLKHSMESPSPAFAALPSDVFEMIEKLNKLLFEPQKSLKGQPLRLDLVSWDKEGYVFGWYTDEQGQPFVGIGSCAQTVSLISHALRALAPCDPEWCALLEVRAQTLQDLLTFSRNRALQVAAERVASQGWFSKLWKPTTIGREMLSLGFDEGKLTARVRNVQ